MRNRVAIYCRLSKEDEEKLKKGDDSESIQNQKLMLIDFAIKQGWSIQNIYSDDDFSGLDKDRPDFKRMIASAEKREFDIILCKHQARFTRDVEVVEKYLHNMFVLWGIRFVSVVDNVDTEVKGGKKSRQINGLVNEWYCEDLSENVRAALQTKKVNGQYLGHWCTFGYELDPHDRHKLVIDPTAAEVVREIYSLYLNGHGAESIANILTKKQYPTPSVYKRAKGKNYYNPSETMFSGKYGVWAVNTIRRILRDKTYIGHLVQGRERKVNYKIKKVVKVPESEWIVVENNHEPIIDEDTFYKAQKLLGIKSSHFKVKDDEIPKPHLFAGKIRCMDCGNVMHKRFGKNNVQYLKCKLAIKTKNKECTLHTIRMDTLTDEVCNRIRQLIDVYVGDRENAQALYDLCFDRNDLDAELKRKRNLLSSLNHNKEELAKGLAAAYMDRVKRTLTEQNFQIIQSNFDNELRQTEEQANELQEQIGGLEDRIRAKEVHLPKLEQYVGFKELTHEIVNDFIDYIEISEKNEEAEQEIIIHWLF